MMNKTYHYSYLTKEQVLDIKKALKIMPIRKIPTCCHIDAVMHVS